MVMELCRVPLSTLLRNAEALTEREVALLAVDITAGLAHLHRHNCVHRDLNLGNFLLTDKGRVKGRGGVKRGMGHGSYC